MATFGDRVARARTKAKLTQGQLAERIGVSRSWVGQVETNRQRSARPSTLRLLSNELGLDYKELLALTNQLGEVEPQPTPIPADRAVIEAIQALTAATQAHAAASSEQAEALRAILVEMRQGREAAQGRDEALAVALDALSEQLAALRPVLAGRSR